MKTFIAMNLVVAECELIAEGLPITQEGAEQFAKKQWRGSARQRKRRQLDGCYKGKR